MSLRAALPTLLLCALPLVAQETSSTQSAKPPSEAELKLWIKQLGDFHFHIRQQASDQLTAAGLAALPHLQEATKHRDPEVVSRAWRIIELWAGEGKVSALLFKLSSESAPLRAAAADQLGKMGAKARDAVPALTDATTKDSSDIVRVCAREALKVIQSTPELKLTLVEQDTPAAVGRLVRYRIEIANDGTAPATTTRIVVHVPETLEIDKVEGPNFRRDGGRVVSLAQTLDPGVKLQWEIFAKAVKAGEQPLLVELLADQLAKPMCQERKSLILEAAPKE